MSMTRLRNRLARMAAETANQPPPPATPIIYGTGGTHLGDCWMFLNTILSTPPTSDETLISKYGIRVCTPMGEILKSRYDVYGKLSEIIPLLENKYNHKIKIVDSDYTVLINATRFKRGKYHGAIPTKTKLVWKNKKHNKISYQFDGISNGVKKNPKQEDMDYLLNEFKDYELVRLGSHLTLQQCVEHLASSDVFMGVESGMYCLAYSANVPAYLLQQTKYPYNYRVYQPHSNPLSATCVELAQRVKSHLAAL